MRDLIDFAWAAGASAACLPAYASEFYKLSEQERLNVVATAVEHSAGRLPIVGQVNQYSARLAVEMALRFEDCGASLLCAAAPRLFALAEDDLFDYFAAVLSRVSLPFIAQDYHPGGASLGPAFLARLHRAFPHFLYVKLEEPRMAGKIEAIREATNGEVGVIEGWGGMYIVELIEAGAVAVMPGLALTDLLVSIYTNLRAARKAEAFTLFREVLPQIVYSLQNMELFHHAEKMLLVARGVLRSSRVRSAGLRLAADEREHIAFLNERIIETLERCGLPRNPMAQQEVP